MKALWSKLPPVHEIDRTLAQRGLAQGLEVRDLVLELLEQLRQNQSLLEGLDRAGLTDWICTQVAAQSSGQRPVINGTGTVVHTNLGRSIFDRGLLAKLPDLFSGYTNLEYDLEKGQRGQRVGGAERLVCRLTGAEAALFVNNNASALLLCLQAFGQGKEVLLSRGEMVEIGGSFRIPEMLETSGAKLKEIGTTNKTHLKDYQKAIGPETAMILKVHRSNFKITGFTAEVPRKELIGLAEERGLVYLEDLGSGALEPLDLGGGAAEPGFSSILAQGAELVTASGDKLLGGPQAGIILGKKTRIDRLKEHPLYRCLRCDKITLFLLEQTLLSYARGAWEKIPTQRMLKEPASAVLERAQKVLDGCPSPFVELVPTLATPGGGALAEESFGSYALWIKLPGASEEELHRIFRSLQTPVIGRVKEGRFLIDLKAVPPEQLEALAAAIRGVLAGALVGDP